jgi:hypothetical protein
MKKLLLFLSIVLVFSSGVFIYHAQTAAAFNSNDLIDDSAFSNVNTMTAAQIDSWLNSNFPSSCISTNRGFAAPDPTGYSPNPSQFFYSSNPVSAGTVIYDAAQAYGINPQVLLATLQKEETLVDGTAGCSSWRYASAVGYGCTDSGTNTHDYSYPSGGLVTPLYYINGSPVNSITGSCVNSGPKTGFSEQIIHAAWLLAFGLHKSEGNTGWAIIKGNWNNCDDNNTCPAGWNIPASDACYGGPMTQGSFKRCPTDPSPTFYDGYTTIDGQSTHMDTGATASLYWYTPHFSGNQSFFNIYSQWFGNPTTPCSGTANLGGVSGSKLIAYRYSQTGLTNLAYSQMNNTGSTCAEVHVDNPGFSSWIAHIATGMRSTDPGGGTFISSKSPVDNKVSINYINYIGGGHVEVHRFSPDLQKFPGYYDVGTNLSNVTPTSGMFVSGDFFGLGYDQIAYIIYSNGTGNVEIHLFDPSMTKAVGYYDLVTDIGGVSGSTGTFVAGDFLGRGYSQLLYIIYSNGTGRVETHMFNSALTKATGTQDIITNIAGFNPAQ